MLITDLPGDTVARGGPASACWRRGLLGKGLQDCPHRPIRRARRIHTKVLTRPELRDRLELRVDPLEKRFTGIGHRWTRRPSPQSLPERRLVASGLDEEDASSVPARQIERAA